MPLSSQIDQVVPLFQKMVAQVPKKDVKHKLGLFRNCFAGKDAAASCGAAMCADMIQLNLMRHFLGEKGFEDSATTFYGVTPIGARFVVSQYARDIVGPELSEAGSGSRVEGLTEVCRQLIQDLELRDRMLGLKTIKACFLGVEAVDWVCANSDKLRRSDAAAVLTEMLKCGLLKPAQSETDTDAFSDTSVLYQALVSPAVLDDFELSNGSAPFGLLPEVALGTMRKGSKRPVALFVVPATDKARKETAAAAAALLRKTVHSNLARVLHSFNSNVGFVVVCERGVATFAEAVLATRAWTESIVAHVVRHVAGGLAVLHAASCVYGSLSPSTIFVAESAASDSSSLSLESLPRIKLAFCDTLRTVAAGSSSKGFSGPFAAPDSVCTTACDLYSLGVLLHHCLCGFLPT